LGAPLDHSLRFWALLLPAAVSRSLWKPQVFSPPHLCRCLFRFTWLGPPVANSPRFCAPLSPTRLALPLETPSFFLGGLPSCELAWPCLWGTSSFSPHKLCPRLFGFVLLDLAFRARGDVSDKKMESCLPGPPEDWPRAICRVGRFSACYHTLLGST
jgi:hypothetical protein